MAAIPGPDHAGLLRAREGTDALQLQLEPFERLGGRGDGPAQFVQIAVSDVAQERQSEVEWGIAPTIGSQGLPGSARTACDRASARSARESGSR